ncbi:LexA family protein, partial [uncultured Micrococcus sp.]|uniref:LexA family protein n=1 Tax=uncultured Micrococcus sp. TaxID=114051 RepID=UPI00345B5554
MASSDHTPPAAVQALTDRQRRIVRTIQEAIAERGYPPSMREIGDAAGLASLSSVTHQLGQLERFGYLRRDPGRPRALEILLDADGRPTGEPAVAAPVPLVPARHTGATDGDSVEVPWVGRIAAGGPILADQQVEEVMAV